MLRAETPCVCGKSQKERRTPLLSPFLCPTSSSAHRSAISLRRPPDDPLPLPYVCHRPFILPFVCSPVARGPTTTWGAHTSPAVSPFGGARLSRPVHFPAPMPLRAATSKMCAARAFLGHFRFFFLLIARVLWSCCHVCATCTSVVVGPQACLCLGKEVPAESGVCLCVWPSHLNVHVSSAHACNCGKENVPHRSIHHSLPLNPFLFNPFFLRDCTCASFACCCRLCGL